MSSTVTSADVQRHRASAPPRLAPAAASLLRQAQRGVDAAERCPDPVERFTMAYRCAIQSAAAVLAARGRPHRGRSRPASVWVLVSATAPELEEWAAFFAAHSGLHAAAQAGISRRVSVRAADDLLRQSAQFLDLARRSAVRRQGADARTQACHSVS